jgi:hypothetical protein
MRTATQSVGIVAVMVRDNEVLFQWVPTGWK